MIIIFFHLGSEGTFHIGPSALSSSLMGWKGKDEGVYEATQEREKNDVGVDTNLPPPCLPIDYWEVVHQCTHTHRPLYFGALHTVIFATSYSCWNIPTGMMMTLTAFTCNH